MGNSTLTVRGSLATAQDITGYGDSDSSNKRAFQRDSRAFLKSLAIALALSPSSYSIRVNAAGPAVSGEVTLHADHLYVQLFEHGRGVEILYRSCESQRDYTGGQNHFEKIRALTDADRQEHFVDTCRKLYEFGRRAAAARAA